MFLLIFTIILQIIDQQQLIYLRKPMKIIVYFMVMFLISCQVNQTCDDVVKAIIDSIQTGNLSSLPLPSIMFSGITNNNPGQKFQCQHKSGKTPYNYFLVDWKNNSNTINTFTGLCVPPQCKKQDIERGLQMLQIKNGKVYEYTDNQNANGLMIFCGVAIGIWVGVLTIWSIIISFKQPVENQLIKKHEEIRQPDHEPDRVNSLLQSHTQVHQFKQNHKIFNFYQGYCKIFKKSENNNNILNPLLFFAAFSIIFSTEFSYRQTISSNQIKSMKWFDSIGGVLFCNIQIAFNVIMFVLGYKLICSIYKLSTFHQIGRFFFDRLLIKWGILFLTSIAVYFFLGFIDEPLNKLWQKNYGADCPSVIYQIWFLFRNLQIDCKTCMPWFWILQAQILLTIIAAPVFIIYRSNKNIGRALIILLIFVSIMTGYAILDSSNIIFEPYKLFNMPKDFTINYQANSIVRMYPFFLGILFSLTINDYKTTEDSKKGKFLALVKTNKIAQLITHLIGLSVMVSMYLIIIPYLQIAKPNELRTEAYTYLIFSNLDFLLGLILFLLPCCLEAENPLVTLMNKFLKLSIWNSIDKMTLGFLVIGPFVIGFTTYSIQNSIYFDFQTIFVYFMGDIVVIYVLTLLAVSAIDNQLYFISKYLQNKIFGNESKYSVLVLQD